MSEYMCKWHRELELFFRLKPLLILEGNIMDLFCYPGSGLNISLPQYLDTFLRERGYETVVHFEQQKGFSASGQDAEEQMRTFAELTGAVTELSGGCLEAAFAGEGEEACLLAGRLMENKVRSAAVIFHMASRYILSANMMQQAQSDAFAALAEACAKAREVYSERAGRYNRNLCILLAEKANDLPVWLFKDNPYAKILHIQTPSREERMEFVDEQGLQDFFAQDIYESQIGFYEEHPKELEKLKEKFVALTEGFTRLELCDLSVMCENERLSIHELGKIVDLYRYGVRENPWTGAELRERLKDGRSRLEERVKGQPAATEQTLQVIKRAVSGLSGLQHSSHGKPKGILFFAGPTGTGKTEMAKSLAELIFGDQDVCIRFDMSEYADPSSDQRLLGASPGYVGYEAGGQLTNAVREHPFSILLFDEIEKAHSSILDKFLQILEDGRMTDGQGDTVYFSECVIIFTSNLGIYELDERTGRRALQVTEEDDYETVSGKVKEGISRYFKLQLGRPEILNRIGENIVVFDFIRKDTAAQIMESQLDKICRTLRQENNVTLHIPDSVKETLLSRICGNLANGGRGVGNVIEQLVLNPLAGYLLDHDLLQDAEVVIEEIGAETVMSGNHGGQYENICQDQ